MSSMYSVVIAEPVRTAVGTFVGSLKDIPAVELGQQPSPPPFNGLACNRR
jgi:hypothetical protein